MKIKHSLTFLNLLLVAFFAKGQIEPGIYNDGLKLAYNPSIELITGIYENYSGYDESTGNPRFSCIFYINGTLKDSIASIETYFPLDKEDDMIAGKLKHTENNEISIKLDDQHGGCWNVWDFSDDFTNFKLQESKNWIEIRYIDIDKAFFYTQQNETTKRKAYVLKGDIVFIDKIKSNWIHCSYIGKTVTTGWLKLDSVNQD